jgi:hypothetical protein
LLLLCNVKFLQLCDNNKYGTEVAHVKLQNTNFLYAVAITDVMTGQKFEVMPDKVHTLGNYQKRRTLKC